MIVIGTSKRKGGVLWWPGRLKCSRRCIARDSKMYLEAEGERESQLNGRMPYVP